MFTNVGVLYVDVMFTNVGVLYVFTTGAGHGQEFKECCLFRQLKWVSFLLRRVCQLKWVSF